MQELVRLDHYRVSGSSLLVAARPLRRRQREDFAAHHLSGAFAVPALRGAPAPPSSPRDQLGPLVNGVVTKLREASDWPDEVQVEFSIKLSADANVIIARTAGEANFRIALRWTGESQ